MARARTSRVRFALTLLRVLVFALALPLVTTGTLPLWAQLVGVEGVHVCHCSIEKHDCVCAKCNPDQDEIMITSESLHGRCGDDEVAFGGKAICAVLPCALTLAPLAVRVLLEVDDADPIGALLPPPPTPPPRSSSSPAV